MLQTPGVHALSSETLSETPPVAPERLMRFLWGFAPGLMIEAAVKNGVFDALDAGSQTAAQVAALTGTSERGLSALLNGLVAFDLLAKDSNNCYTLTPESAAFLVRSRPSFHGALFAHTSTQLMPMWLGLTDIVRTGQPASSVNLEGDGTAFFEDFVEALFPLNYPGASVLGHALGISQGSGPLSVLDLAAGSGVWGIALAQQSPRVQVTAVDWPGVLETTRRVAQRHGLQDRFTFVAGDLASVDFGAGHQVATLGHILHSEGKERSRALLGKVYEALAPGGTIAVAEFLMNEERTGPPQAAIFALNMVVNTSNGDAYTFDEIAGWLQDAGFVEPRPLPIPAPSPLILAVKPV